MHQNEQLELLIVSEDWFARSLFKTAAQETGLFASIKTAEDGYTALAEVWQSIQDGAAPNAVLIYSELVGMSGPELARRLHEDEDTRKIFIAFCGSSGEPPPVTDDADFSTSCDAAISDLTEMLRAIGMRLVGADPRRITGY